MISVGTKAVRRIGCSAGHHGYLVGEGKLTNACRPRASRTAGDSWPRQILVSGSGPVEGPDWRGVSIAQLVKSVISCWRGSPSWG